MRHLPVVLFALAALAPHLHGQDKDQDITSILIKNVKVFDGTNEQLKVGPVLIENNLIKSIGPATKVPDGAIEIDGKGGTVMPGLIDMHAHHAIHEGSPWRPSNSAAHPCHGYSTLHFFYRYGQGKAGYPHKKI